MNNANKTKIVWKTPSFQRGFLDGLNVFSFIAYPYQPKAIWVPMVGDAWRDVGKAMNGAIMEHTNSEKTAAKKADKKASSVKAH